MSLLRAPWFGPSWREVFLSFACSVLLATEVAVGRSSNLPQTAEAYYNLLDRTATYRWIGIGLDSLVLLATLAWIVLPRTSTLIRSVLLVLAAAGTVACWSEILWATTVTGHVFVLRELPFRPLANFGLAGAIVFGSYLAFRVPSGHMPKWQTFLVQGSLVLCQAAFQLVIWDAVSGRHLAAAS